MNEMMLQQCENYKPIIQKLYCDEGKPKEYIRNLLGLTREPLNTKIKEWGFVRKQEHTTPSTKKFIAKHREKIVSMLRNNYDVKEIAQAIGTTVDKAGWIIRTTPDLHEELLAKKQRKHDEFVAREQSKSGFTYDFDDLQNEVWKPVLGYSRYQVSNMGRVKAYSAAYKAYYLLKAYRNSLLNRWYISMVRDDGKTQNLILARVVAHAFCDGFSATANTVNHKDGNTDNNCADNLEWVSQSQNLKHSYDTLNRPHNIAHPLRYKILYRNTYSFKTVAAFARFIGKSETTARRWLECPDKHDIQLIA